MKYASIPRARLNGRLSRLCIVACCCLTGCGDDDSDDGLPLPVPDSFEAYFVSGSVCMPTNIPAGGTYPIRFDICRHRCITLGAQTFLQTAFQCALGQCQMAIMAHAPATRNKSEQNCDGRELLDPPADSCTLESYAFNDVGAPVFSDGMAVTGNMQVSVPFMDLEQAQQVEQRVNAGESPTQVLNEVVGPPPSDRQWTINLDPGHPTVSDAASLGGADCHPIASP